MREGEEGDLAGMVEARGKTLKLIVFDIKPSLTEVKGFNVERTGPTHLAVGVGDGQRGQSQSSRALSHVLGLELVGRGKVEFTLLDFEFEFVNSLLPPLQGSELVFGISPYDTLVVNMHVFAHNCLDGLLAIERVDNLKRAFEHFVRFFRQFLA
jgi:hypothetical protein